ncbi:hypothetical protein BBK14_08530 [Parafrankia soli]|uniref:Uncharacterized protein n=1 Tax=Parafrankia soli TaxID=2599596 RepID=A0A1S1PGN4_9ACTN|nr:hypothetical protein [Parafrankia soli]OHV20269.1 hypothetical protein BBK14_08530 [Parafrankia soli]
MTALAALALAFSVAGVALVSPAEAREPSPPYDCHTDHENGTAWAWCHKGYGTYRAWARCNWSASTLYGTWYAPRATAYMSTVKCRTSTHPNGVVMANGIQKRDG